MGLGGGVEGAGGEFLPSAGSLLEFVTKNVQQLLMRYKSIVQIVRGGERDC